MIQKLNSTLHKSFAKLFTVQKDFKRAREEIAQCIYLEANEFGPEHIALSRGYYLLAKIFALERKFEEAIYIFNKIKEIWNNFLNQGGEVLNEIHLDEGMDVLTKILEFYEIELGET